MKSEFIIMCEKLYELAKKYPQEFDYFNSQDMKEVIARTLIDYAREIYVTLPKEGCGERTDWAFSNYQREILEWCPSIR